jgi:hypothetical protein
MPVLPAAVLAPVLAPISEMVYAPAPVSGTAHGAAVPAAGQAGPARPAAAAAGRHRLDALETLGRFCDAVYTGVNSAASGIRRACASMVERLVAAASSAKDSNSQPGPTQAARGGAAMGAAAPGFSGADLAWSLDSALKATEVVEAFQGEGATYDNLRYLTGSLAFRTEADREGRGMGSTAKASDSLMRRLTTGAQSAEDPWRIIPAAATSAQFDAVRADYRAYRRAAYPEFEDVKAYLNAFGDPTQAQEAIERMESRDFDDASSDLDADHVKEIERFAQNVAWMRRCLAAMSAYLKMLDERR